MSIRINVEIRIDHMEGEPNYTGRTGTVTHIDDAGQIHGTWGGCALHPSYGDRFTVIEENGGMENNGNQEVL